MRSNGLTAEAYSPVADQLSRSAAADALLALRDEGVAAYVVLSGPDDEHATVFADRAALDRAREIVHGLDGSSTDEDAATPDDPATDAAWQGIVAGFDDTATPDEGHFVPPPPLPGGPPLDPVTRLAWIGVFGGPFALVVAAVLSWSPPRMVVLLAVGAFVGGIITLVARMDDEPPAQNSGPDDGAVI